ncbi:MAG: alpha/beta fold hydrolase [Candidatus Moranbacteria bacterium]|nr:alpha/beta fold hydrolase [Candidatus Moranbacteria bacterium]
MDEEKKYSSKPIFLKGCNETGVLLLHGWASPPDELLLLAKYLNSFGYTVSAPLLRGHWAKPEDLLGVTWKDWFEDSQKALDELKKQNSQVFVGGISMGGDLAMLLSEDESVKGIIALGAPIRFHFHTLAKAGLFFMGLFKTYRKKYYPPWVGKETRNRKVYSFYPVENVKEVIRMVEATEKFLPHITKPILIVQSSSDFLVSNRTPRLIFGGVKSKTKEIFWMKDAFHVFVENRKVWEKIKEFVEKI